MALSLAEQHGNAELYREASRFVLDRGEFHASYSTSFLWTLELTSTETLDMEEMEDLSEQTRLKLSQRCVYFTLAEIMILIDQTNLVPGKTIEAGKYRCPKGVYLCKLDSPPFLNF